MYNMAKVHVGFKGFPAPMLWSARWFATMKALQQVGEHYGKELRMSETVVFTKRGLMNLKWNEDTRQFDESEIDFALIHLRELCLIEPGCTLGHVFAAIEQHEDLIALISFYSWCPQVKEFLDQAKLPPPEAKTWNDGDYLEIYKEVDLSGNYFDVFTDWHAVSNIEGEKHVSVSYMPMNEIAMLPVQINEEITVRQIGGAAKIEGNLIRPGLKTTFSFLEVLHAIFDDISWHGGPGETAAILAESKQEKDQFMKELEEGTLSTRSAKEVFDDLRADAEERRKNPAEQDSWKDESLEDAMTRHAREYHLPRAFRKLRGQARYDKLQEMYDEGSIATGEYNWIKDILDGKDVSGLKTFCIHAGVLAAPKPDSGAGE